MADQSEPSSRERIPGHIPGQPWVERSKTRTTRRCRHILLRTLCRSLACTLLGVHLSGKLAQRVVQVNVISHDQSHKVKAAIRQAGFALTRHPGTGLDGPVDVMDVLCSSGQLPHLVQAGTALEPKLSRTGISW